MNVQTDEIMDLVDEQDRVIGMIMRSEAYAHKIPNIRSINAFIKNSHGELWIPRRTEHKKVYPLCLDMSVSGCVARGETYDEAFKRETAEELNLDIDRVQWKLLGTCTPAQHEVFSFMKVYELYSDVSPDYNVEDICEGFWLKPEEAVQMIINGEPAKSGLIKLLKIFYL